MELLQLRYFLDSAQLGSFARTAEKHMVPASSVSATIRRLEQTLGQQLFDRSSNRIRLNANGMRLKKSAEIILSELEQAVNDITYPPGQQVIRLLVLSLRSDITNWILEYQKQHPGVVFDTSINYQEEKFEDFDIIIGTPDDRYEGFVQFELVRCPVRLRVASNHFLAGKELTLRQLQEESFVTMGGNLHNIVVSACRKAGFTPNVIAKINDLSCFLKYIQNSASIGHCRDYGRGAGQGFVFLNVTDFNAYQQVNVYYRKTPAKGNIENFLAFLKSKRK